MKKVLSLILICLFLLCSCSIKTPDEYYSTEETNSSDVIYINIDCKTALSVLPQELKDGNYIPDDGIILSSTVEYEDGDTAFSALLKASKANKIQIDYSGEGESVYLRGISHLYEFSCGNLSGWMCNVNDEFIDVSAGSYTLKPNDTVNWLYTCDMGVDIGNSYTGE